MGAGPILTLAAVALGVVALGVGLAKRFIYFQPGGNCYGRKCLSGVEAFREAHISALGMKGASNTVILMCHGNAGNVYDRQDKLRALHNLGHTAVVFDYSGYGLSFGEPSEAQCYLDGEVMVDYLRKTYPDKKIVVYGESLGGPVACYLAAKYRLGQVVLEAPLPGIRPLICARVPGWISWLGYLVNDFDAEAHLSGYAGKVLLMHSLGDEIIPYSSTEALRALACVETLEIKGYHNSGQIPWSKVGSFLAK